MRRFLAVAAAATLAGVPAAMAVAQDIQLVTCGVRHTLWIEHYAAGLYVAPGASAQAARDAKQSKTVRLRMVETRDLPQRIPKKWRRALQGELSGDAMARVDSAYEGLAGGDVVSIRYAPANGVELRVNERVLARAPGHGVIDAILAAWAEKEPIAAKLEELVREHGCAPQVAAFLAGAERLARRGN